MSLRDRIIELYDCDVPVKSICKLVGSSSLIVNYVIECYKDPDKFEDIKT